MTKAKRAAVREQWRVRVAEYRASGLSASEWCKANGQKTHRLWYWIRRFKAEEASDQECSRWLPVQVINLPAPEASLSIRVGHATVTVSRGFDQALLLDVVRTLTSLC